MEKEIKLQTILLPKGEPYHSLWNMYDRGEEKVITKENKLLLNKGQVFDASTYFNSCPAKKWFLYTKLYSIKLKLTLQGSFTLKLYSHSVEDITPIEENARFSLEHHCKVLYSESFVLTEEKELVLEYPRNEDCLYSFAVVAHDTSCLVKGSYVGSVAEEKLRPVVLSMAITTFRKEEFVLPNIELLRKEILESGEEMAENFYVHVVDNGRTLDVKDAKHSHIKIHPNINAGGSGGFARGMLEALGQENVPTHLLLMDDDVLIQTESIRRTYTLLQILKDKYQDHFISGAMLFYENMHVQHEDVGYVDEYGAYGPVKPLMDFYRIEDCCYNELAPLDKKNQYAGWWYCCIPMKFVREDNLPLPLFVRGDDVEYSLRNQAKFITMNGICVWHMGFTRKFNAMMELYQVHRNSLIFQAVSGVCEEVNFLNRMEYFVRLEVMRFNYNSAELLLEAVEDYMKGPEFLTEPKGEEIVKEKSRKNEKLVPLQEFPEIEVNISEIYQDLPYTKLEYVLHRMFYNGLYLPKKFMQDDVAVIAYDWFCAIGKQYRHSRLLAVNPHTMEGAMRIMDRKRGKAILKRARKVFCQCRKQQPNLTKRYREWGRKFVTAEFWNTYLYQQQP